MKKLTLILLPLLLTSGLYGQTGLIANDSLLWQQTTYYTTGPSGSGQGLQYFFTYKNYFINGDTTVGSQTFKKLYSSSVFVSTAGYNPPAFDYSSLTFNSFILEDSDCVYKGTPGDLTKILDFTIQVGDSFSFSDYLTKVPLLSIDSVMLYGSYRQRFNFEKGIVWIKGIGDVTYGATFGSYYFFNSSPYHWMTWGSQFRCYSEKNAPTHGDHCNLPLGIAEKDVDDRITIYPIPAENVLYVVSETNELKYVIYSLLGHPLKKGVISNAEVIDIKMLPKGSYVINFIDKDNQSSSRLFIKY